MSRSTIENLVKIGRVLGPYTRLIKGSSFEDSMKELLILSRAPEPEKIERAISLMLTNKVKSAKVALEVAQEKIEARSSEVYKPKGSQQNESNNSDSFGLPMVARSIQSKSPPSRAEPLQHRQYSKMKSEDSSQPNPRSKPDEITARASKLEEGARRLGRGFRELIRHARRPVLSSLLRPPEAGGRKGGKVRLQGLRFPI